MFFGILKNYRPVFKKRGIVGHSPKPLSPWLKPMINSLQEFDTETFEREDYFQMVWSGDL